MNYASSSKTVRPSPIFLGTLAATAFGGVLAWVSSPDSTLAVVGVFVFVLAGWIVTLALHEFSHAYTAWHFGDHDVVLKGYLDLDIRRYTDPFTSLVIPLVLVLIGGIGLPGAAVYLDTRWMGKKQRSLISLAGPFANLLAAVVLLTVGAVGASREHLAFWSAVEFLGLLQVFAVVINILPIPGFDGYGALEPWLKPETQRKLQPVRQWAFFVFFAFLIFPNPVQTLFYNVVLWLFGLLGGSEALAGYGAGLVQFWRRTG